MNRLTARNEDGSAYYKECYEKPCYGCGCQNDDCELEIEVCMRLAAYEDIDITPKQMQEISDEYRKLCEKLHKVNSELAEYKRLEEQGLLLRLPCKIGSDVYFIPSKVNYELNKLSHHEENNRVYHQKVARITFTERGWYLECDKDLEYGVDRILLDKFFEETWFLTQEEAEQALKQNSEV